MTTNRTGPSGATSVALRYSPGLSRPAADEIEPFSSVGWEVAEASDKATRMTTKAFTWLMDSWASESEPLARDYNADWGFRKKAASHAAEEIFTQTAMIVSAQDNVTRF